MFDMRAYVTSLAAVFLALGIGILLGTIIIDKGTVQNQQNALLKSIESKITSVAEDNKSLRKELEQNNRFQQEVSPHIIQGRLEGKNIAIVHSGNLDDDLIKNIKSVIGTASGTAEIVEIKDNTFDFSSSNIEKMKKLISTAAVSVNEDEAKIIPASLASALSLPTSSVTLLSLKEQDFIDFSGSENIMFSAVLILLDSENDMSVLDKFYKPMIDSLKGFTLPVVLAEASLPKDKEMISRLKDGDIMTVDNIDNIPGQIAMVLGLAGKTGNFGINSKNLIPGVETNPLAE